MIKQILGAALTVSLTMAASAAAQVTADGQRAVGAYRTALTDAEAGKPGAVERAFDALTPVRDTLLQGQLLQSLSEDAYAQLVRQLRGVIISRRNPEFVQPDLTYFVRLAETHGSAADKAFFAALKATYPDSVFPVYLQRQADAGGCARFGSFSLADSYRTWSQFKTRFPGRYDNAVSDETEAIFEILTDGTCACGTAAQVERELTEFNTRFPSSPIKTELDGRLRDIRSGQAGIRANCRAE